MARFHCKLFALRAITHTILACWYLPFVLFFFQLVLTVSRFFQLPELVSDCHSVYQQPRERKIFDFFVACSSTA